MPVAYRLTQQRLGGHVETSAMIVSGAIGIALALPLCFAIGYAASKFLNR